MVENSLSSFSEEISKILPYLMRGMFKKGFDVMGFGKITIPQFMTLDILDFYKTIKMKDIAKILNISLPATTGLVGRLHKIGMIKRIYDKKDRRVIYISLTPRGNQAVKKVRIDRKKMIENLFSKLTEKERENYLKILRKLKKVVENENSKN